MTGFDVVVVGGGTAGLTAALAARQEGATVALVEREERIGGDCTFYGCVPSKALIEVAQTVHNGAHLHAEGILDAPPRVSFAAVAARRDRVVAEIAREVRDERFAAAGIEVVHGEASFADVRELRVGDRTLHGKRFVIATGSEPVVPPLDGLDAVPYLTNRTVFSLGELPRRLLVLGGGSVGLELAQAFRRLGSEVAVVEMADRLLVREEPEAGEIAHRVLVEEGVELRLGTPASAVRSESSEVVLSLGAAELRGDALLVAVGPSIKSGRDRARPTPSGSASPPATARARGSNTRPKRLRPSTHTRNPGHKSARRATGVNSVIGARGRPRNRLAVPG